MCLPFSLVFYFTFTNVHVVSPTLIQELNALSAPSPSPSPVPPSPIVSEHSPNIYITSPPSPSHSAHGHPSVPMLNIPQYALHASSPSPTSSDFQQHPFSRHGRQPSITLTPDADRDGPGREKRQRTGEEDVEAEMSLDLDMDVGGSVEKKNQQQQQRARSDSAPTWVTGAGGLTANWGRPRSGSGYGR